MDTKLDEALRLFTERNIDEIPIVATTPPGFESSRSSITTAVKTPHGAVGN